MRQIAITAMLCAAAVAGLRAPKRATKTMQEEGDWVDDLVLPPDSSCMYYDAYRWEDTEDGCGAAWNNWDEACREEWWTPYCERVEVEYRSQNFDDFIEPTRPDAECAVAPHEMSEDCMEQWDTLYQQCDDGTD